MDISVIIPTRDRCRSLCRALDALARQSIPADRFEVIVAVDGSRDDTVATLRHASTRFPLRTVAFRESRGAAAARNLGARSARAPLLVFLDDDVEAAPDLLAEYFAARAGGADVAIGYLKTVTNEKPGLFGVLLRGWWESMFATMRDPAHRYSFKDILTGNCAIDAAAFWQAGGLDEGFRCHEDYELGVRLIRQHREIRFVRRAQGVHHERTTLAGAFARKVDEGRSDIRMIRKHPQLVPVLPLGIFEQFATHTQTVLRRMVFERPAAGRLLARGFAGSLPLLESARLRGRWQRRVYDLLHYWYWRGVRDAVGTFDQFERLAAARHAAHGQAADKIDLDVREGLVQCMDVTDARRPDAVHLRYGGESIGDIPALPGSERLRGVHLKGELARGLLRPFLSALGRSGAIAVTVGGDSIVATGKVPVESLRL